MIGYFVKSRIAGKWCERDAELECRFALDRKRSKHIEIKSKEEGMWGKFALF